VRLEAGADYMLPENAPAAPRPPRSGTALQVSCNLHLETRLQTALTDCRRASESAEAGHTSRSTTTAGRRSVIPAPLVRSGK
jgi:hypothetical protein